MNKETKDVLVGVFAVVLIIGSVYYFSTNSSTSPTNPTENTQANNSLTNTPTIFYTQSVANVRSCAAISCSSLGTYPVNSEFSLPYSNVNDLPEWVEFSFPDSNGVTQTGYINKSTLGIKKVTIIPEQQAQQPTVPTYTAPAYVETNSSCRLKAEGVLNRSWIRTCNLRGQLTYQCQQLFDADGNHKNWPQVGDPNWSEKFGQILTDIVACECQLPSDVVASLKYTQQLSNSSCDKFYPN